MNVCTRFSLFAFAFLVAGVALAGCGGKKDSGPTCRQIVTYMMRIREFGTFDERGAIEECRRQKWSAKQRRCLYSAKSLDDMAKCVPAVKTGTAGPRKLPLPEWHPRTDLPIETGPERLERERLERERLEREGKSGEVKPPPTGAGMPDPAAPTTPPAAPAPTAPAPTPPAAPAPTAPAPTPPAAPAPANPM
jgi:hypothetical protein